MGLKETTQIKVGGRSLKCSERQHKQGALHLLTWRYAGACRQSETGKNSQLCRKSYVSDKKTAFSSGGITAQLAGLLWD